MAISQEEYVMMSELLRSENATEILETMCRRFAGFSTEHCNRLLGMIPGIAQANIRRMDSDLILKQKAFETLEYMLPAGKQYPHGIYGVLTVVYSQCNFKRMWEDSRDPLSGRQFLSASRALQGHPGLGAVLYHYRDYIKASRGREWAKDDVWVMVDDDNVKEMVQWCIDNEEKWDDLGDAPAEPKGRARCARK